MHTHVSVHARAVQAYIYTECYASPCWVSSAAVKTRLVVVRNLVELDDLIRSTLLAFCAFNTLNTWSVSCFVGSPMMVVGGNSDTD